MAREKAHNGSGQRHNQAADHQRRVSGWARKFLTRPNEADLRRAFYDSCRRLTTRRLGQQRGASPPEGQKSPPDSRALG
jgi:hypothetical protein